MPTLAALAARFFAEERPAGNLLDEETILAQALAAVSLYAGYTEVSSLRDIDPAPALSGATDISLSEWALIRPLFLLYVERENALYLEASRGHGVDVFGRSSGEIAGDILQTEAELPHRAFCLPITTV